MLSVDGDGLVVYELKHPFADGTTHVLFEPLDFIARLAALVSRPRVHLLRLWHVATSSGQGVSQGVRSFKVAWPDRTDGTLKDLTLGL